VADASQATVAAWRRASTGSCRQNGATLAATKITRNTATVALVSRVTTRPAAIAMRAPLPAWPETNSRAAPRRNSGGPTAARVSLFTLPASIADMGTAVVASASSQAVPDRIPSARPSSSQSANAVVANSALAMRNGTQDANGSGATSLERRPSAV
jgi:hypothetical protein